jgi:hypothetical protein
MSVEIPVLWNVTSVGIPMFWNVASVGITVLWDMTKAGALFCSLHLVFCVFCLAQTSIETPHAVMSPFSALNELLQQFNTHDGGLPGCSKGV